MKRAFSHTCKALRKDGILFVTCKIPLPRPLFLNISSPYSPSMLFRSIFYILSRAKILLSFTFYSLLRNKHKNDRNKRKTTIHLKCFLEPYMPPPFSSLYNWEVLMGTFYSITFKLQDLWIFALLTIFKQFLKIENTKLATCLLFNLLCLNIKLNR